MYNIEVVTEDSSWVVSRRYRQFYDLHEKLQQKYALVKGFDFPKKKIVGSLKPKTVNKRKMKLESYLQKCIASQLEQDPLLREFLELQRQGAKLKSNYTVQSLSESAHSKVLSPVNMTATTLLSTDITAKTESEHSSKISESSQRDSTSQTLLSTQNTNNLSHNAESNNTTIKLPEPSEANTILEGFGLNQAYANEPTEIILKTVRDDIENDIHAVLVPEGYPSMNLVVTRKGNGVYTISFVMTRPGNCELTVYYTDKRIKIAGPYTIKVISKEVSNNKDALLSSQK